jgi:hypothetical protein
MDLKPLLTTIRSFGMLHLDSQVPRDKACNPNKKPDLAVLKSNEYGDTVCVIALDVPAKNDYRKRSTGGEAVMLD